jgi:hypothetical protein
MPCRDLYIDVVPIERAIGGDGGDRTTDGSVKNLEQAACLSRVDRPG